MPREPTDPLPTRFSLIGRIKNPADEESWKTFADTYSNFIRGVALKAGLTEGEANEVVQEVLIAVSNKIVGFKADPKLGSFKAWLTQQTRWRIADQFRKRIPVQARRESHQTDRTGTIERIADPASLDLDQTCEVEWKKSLVTLALQTLKRKVKPQQFQIYDLHVVQEVPATKTAQMLGVTIAQVYLVKHRLHGKLQRILRELAHMHS